MNTQTLACGLMAISAVAALVAASGPIASSGPLLAVYIVAVVALGLGSVLRKSAGRSSSENVSTGRRSLPLRSLESLSQAIDDVWGDESCRGDPHKFNQRLREAIEPPMREFLSHRQTMIDGFGVAQFADLMIRFAAVERLLNRAISASADGAIHEATECLSRARDAMATCLTSRILEGVTVATPPASLAPPT